MNSSLLLIGANYAQAVVPSTLIPQVEFLLELHRIPEAISLADQYLHGHGHRSSLDDEIRYVYQRIGFQCLSETLFEEAGECLFNGELDPRLLVSYFPNLRGSLFSQNDSINVYSGVAKHMPPESSIENLISNYSPHLSPNTRTAPPTTELRRIYLTNADTMLTLFLRKYRAKRLMEQLASAQQQNVKLEKLKEDPVDVVIDTVLAKLLAKSERTADLYGLLNEPNRISLPELESVLVKTGQYHALCMLYSRDNQHDKLLTAWSRIAEGEWTDEDVPDPVGDMVKMLEARRDRTLTQKWGVWLTKRDPERGLKLLMSGRRSKDKQDDLALLEQIKEVHPEAGDRFLEYLVLSRRSTSSALHTQLALSCIDQLFAAISDDSVEKLWRAKASSFASSKKEATSTFLSSFASTTPESTHKRIRLKALLCLQGSRLYDLSSVQARFMSNDRAIKLLSLEKAIVEGRAGEHRAALSTLANTLHDSLSAEAYCTLGGDVISAKAAHLLGEQYGLKEWSTALFPPLSTKTNATSEQLKRQLLKVLLEVYTNDGAGSTSRAAHLINAQAVNLDTIEVISTMPLDWPLNLMDSFLARTFRRATHDKIEGQIVKNLSAGQNLEVVAETWGVLRDQGGVVEEALEPDEEKAVVITSEKIANSESARQIEELLAVGEKAATQAAADNTDVIS